jgi:hypothetical protein
MKYVRYGHYTTSIVCNIVAVGSLPAASSRAANLAVVNFVLLLLGARIELVTDLLGLSRRSCLHMHGTVGVMTYLQSVVHILICTQLQKFSLHDPLQFYGFLVSPSVITIPAQHYCRGKMHLAEA